MARFEIDRKGNFANKNKSAGITEKLRATNLKELRSFLGAVNLFNKFIPGLAVICAPVRSILRKDATWKWNDEHEKAILNVSSEVKKEGRYNTFQTE